MSHQFAGKDLDGSHNRNHIYEYDLRSKQNYSNVKKRNIEKNH